MAEVTVRQLAEQVGIPVDRLLVQLGESGLPHSDAEQAINDDERAQLLTHLRELHGKTGQPAVTKKPNRKSRSLSSWPRLTLPMAKARSALARPATRWLTVKTALARISLGSLAARLVRLPDLTTPVL